MKRKLALAAVAASVTALLTVAGTWGSVAAAAGAPCPASKAVRTASYVEQGPDGPRAVLISFDSDGNVTEARDLVIAALD